MIFFGLFCICILTATSILYFSGRDEMINCTESSLLSPVTEGGISEARRDVYKVVLCVIPPRTSQTDSKISRTVYQHVLIVKPGGSDQNAAREAKQFHGMSGLKFFSSNFNSYPSFKTANKHQFHTCFSPQNSPSVPIFLFQVSWNKTTSFNTRTLMRLSEFIFVYLNFCQTDSSCTSPGGITENIQYLLVLGTHLYMVCSIPEWQLQKKIP